MRISHFKWNPSGIRELFLSDQVFDICKEKADEHKPVSEGWINSKSHARKQGGKEFREPCGADARRLRNTCVGIVYPKTKGAAAIARKYGMK